MMENVIGEIDDRLSIHDFRVVSGPSHTNLIFDLVIPHNLKLTQEEIKARIDEKLKKKEKRYYTVITFDNSYCE